MSWRKLEREERIRVATGFGFVNTKSLQQATLVFFFLVSGFPPVFFGGQEKEEDAERVPWGSVLVTPGSVLRDVREMFYHEV